MALSTDKYENKIKKAETWEDMEKVLKELPKVTLRQRVEELCKKYEKSFSFVCGFAGIPESTFYAAINGTRTPKKDLIIKFSIVLGATKDELNELLKLANLKELYAKNNEDAIVMYGIKNGLDLEEIDMLLKSQHCKMRFFREKSNG
ncbi:MAG: hypothetical protein IKJ83_02215 [Ruminococcus sp.]|nr:hypothetical protein [Ruminococcus sp.]